MPTKITMPQLGESVSEGTVGRWLKNEGDKVKKDEPLVEIITDKITEEMPSPFSGVLARIIVKENETVKVGAEIAEMEAAGSAATTSPTTSAATATGQAPSNNTSTTTSNVASRTSVAAPGNGNTSNNTSNGSSGGRQVAFSVATPEKISPLARRLAQEHAVDLSTITGSGEGGRVRKEDILAYIEQQQGQPVATIPTTPTTAATAATAAPSPTFSTAPMPPAPPVPVFANDEIITPTPARRAIAEHMVRSKHTSPHATTLVEVDMTNLARWLEQHKEEFKQREGVSISYQTFAVKATIEALKEFPYMNSSWTDDGKIVLRRQIHIGVSIALSGGQSNNLIVPVIHNADTLNLAGIARAMSDLVGRARANKLTSADMQGATFTVNNPGVFGTLISMAIINQPNAGILTMDSVNKRPVVIDDAIAIRQMMYMSLSFDHRILDGMTAAQFLVAIKRRLESWGPEIDVY